MRFLHKGSTEVAEAVLLPISIKVVLKLQRTHINTSHLFTTCTFLNTATHTNTRTHDTIDIHGSIAASLLRSPFIVFDYEPFLLPILLLRRGASPSPLSSHLPLRNSGVEITRHPAASELRSHTTQLLGVVQLPQASSAFPAVPR